MAHTPKSINVKLTMTDELGKALQARANLMASLDGEFTCRTVKRRDNLYTTTLTMVGWTADDLEDFASLLPPPMRWSIINSLTPQLDPNQLTIV